MTDVRGCFEKGYLKEIPPSKGLAIKSLRQARFFIEETEDLINLNKEEMAVISLYNAFFHISRSILFRDGVKERSHFCLARYIEERYVSKGTVSEIFLNNLEVIRDLRHETQYSVNEIEINQDLGRILDVCREYLENVEKIIG